VAIKTKKLKTSRPKGKKLMEKEAEERYTVSFQHRRGETRR